MDSSPKKPVLMPATQFIIHNMDKVKFGNG